jgi:hypothetical protein
MINLVGCAAEIHKKFGSKKFTIADLDGEYDEDIISAIVSVGLLKKTNDKMMITEEAIAMIKASF